MRPAFSSARQASTYAVLLAVLLALPAAMTRSARAERSDGYRSMPWRDGEYPWIEEKVFRERGDVDLAFVGSSRIWAAIDTPYVAGKLGEQLGRPATVLTLGWNWHGFDALYVVAHDLLEHRRVRTLVIYDEHHDEPHTRLHRLLRWGSDPEALGGLPFRYRASLYGGAVLGLPRRLLSLARPDQLEAPSRWGANELAQELGAADYRERLGSLRARAGLVRSRAAFVPYRATTPAAPADALVYSGETRSAFSFPGPRSGEYARHFARKLGRLCAAKGTTLVVLHLPLLAEARRVSIDEREPWAELVDAPVSLVGIPASRLFAGVPERDVAKLFYDPVHLNANGQDLFTPLVTPTLLRLHAAAATHP